MNHPLPPQLHWPVQALTDMDHQQVNSVSAVELLSIITQIKASQNFLQKHINQKQSQFGNNDTKSKTRVPPLCCLSFN